MPLNDYTSDSQDVTEQTLRRMSRWGYGIFFVWAVVLVTWAIIDPDPYILGWWLALDNLLAGRGVCLYEGVRLGFGKPYLILQCGGQDIAMTLVTVPWIIRFHNHVSRARFFAGFLKQIDDAAERNQARLRGFGLAGLYVFAFMPTAGPMMGSVVGYLLGLPLRATLIAVFAGHLSSLLVFMTFFHWLEPHLRSTNEGLATYFAWIGLAIALTIGAAVRLYKKWAGRSEAGNEVSLPAAEVEPKYPE